MRENKPQEQGHRYVGVVERALVLDVFSLNKRRSRLEKGPSAWGGEVEWRRSLSPSDYLRGYREDQVAAVLQIAVDQHGDHFELELVGFLSGPQRIQLTETPCYFGRLRYWFRCPGPGCGKRVAKLYLPPQAPQFLCRQCHNLTYLSCRKSRRMDDGG